MIPLGTDRPSAVRPAVTVGILLANLAVWVACMKSPWADDLYSSLGLSGIDPRWWQYATYQFVHDRGDAWHLLGNAIFFWTFGSALERRLGSWAFGSLYVAMGAGVGLLYPFVSGPFSMLIGASGTVCACSAAFAVFYPRARVIVLMWGVWRIPALWFVAIFAVIDVLGVARSAHGVAYAAHLLGYAIGGTVAFEMLALKLLPRDDFDLFFVVKQWRRRAQMRAAMAGRVGGVFESASADTASQARTHMRGGDDRVAMARAVLGHAIAAQDWGTAAERTRALVALKPHWSLPEAAQLALANGLLEAGHRALAADAYEELLRAHAGCSQRESVHVLLATICARTLHDPARARAVLARLTASAVSQPTAALVAQLQKELG